MSTTATGTSTGTTATTTAPPTLRRTAVTSTRLRPSARPATAAPTTRRTTRRTPRAPAAAPHYLTSYSLAHDLALVMLDLRSERTRTQVLSDHQRRALHRRLSALPPGGLALVVSSVPPIHLRFGDALDGVAFELDRDDTVATRAFGSVERAVGEFEQRLR